MIRRFESWLFAPAAASRFVLVRGGLFGLLAVRLATGPFADLAGQPDALWRPRSFMRLLPSMPPRGVIVAVQLVAVAAAIVAAAGRGGRAAAPVAWLGGAFVCALPNSLGKIVHNDVLLLLALAPFAAHALLGRGAFGWPVRTAMVVVAGAYFFAGIAKLTHAGPAWVVSDNLRWVLYASSDGQAQANPLALFIADRPVLAHLLAATTLGLELAFPLALLRPRLAPLFAVGAVALHAGIRATMGLDYTVQALVVVVVLPDWPALVRGLVPRRVPYASDVERATLLYDEDCGFCRWAMSKVLAWDRHRRLRPMALQDREAGELLGDMPEERRMASWHLVEPDGTVHSGGDAVAPLARLLPAGAPVAAVARLLPGPTRAVYGLVARNRTRLARVVGEQACRVDPKRARAAAE